MKTRIFDTPQSMGEAAGKDAAILINAAIANNDEANIILATGASQFETLKTLVAQPVDWNKVTVFHLDEYVSIDDTHPASFVKYLRERFLEKVGKVKEFHFINGNTDDPQAECDRLNALIGKVSIDVALVGIGENGHLAFNDPPADFEVEDPYIVVNLDEKCRMQQVGEGWFKGLEDVPEQAISMSIRQIMKSREIICSVPDVRKAQAVKNCVTGKVTNMHPSSILQQHDHCVIYLDKGSASLL